MRDRESAGRPGQGGGQGLCSHPGQVGRAGQATPTHVQLPGTPVRVTRGHLIHKTALSCLRGQPRLCETPSPGWWLAPHRCPSGGAWLLPESHSRCLLPMAWPRQPSLQWDCLLGQSSTAMASPLASALGDLCSLQTWRGGREEEDLGLETGAW